MTYFIYKYSTWLCGMLNNNDTGPICNSIGIQKNESKMRWTKSMKWMGIPTGTRVSLKKHDRGCRIKVDDILNLKFKLISAFRSGSQELLQNNQKSSSFSCFINILWYLPFVLVANNITHKCIESFRCWKIPVVKWICKIM